MSLNDFALPAARRSVASKAVNALLQKLVVILCLGGLVAGVRGADDVALPPVPPTNTVAEPDPQLLRSVLILQEQLRVMQQAVDQARGEAQAEARRSAEAMAARLNQIEQTLQVQRQQEQMQREQELRDLQRSTRAMLIIVGVTTAIGFLAVLVAGIMQARAASQLTEVARQLASLPAAGVPQLTSGPGPQGEQVEAASANLLGAIDRLEHRLEEMESGTSSTQTATHGHKQIATSVSTTSPVATVLSKGQALLNLDQAEEALDQFEEALRQEPRNLEAWIKRGTALERLQRIEEAITSYDQAIAIDGSMATAYLFKAGVYNRQKKYAEALQCYEKALNAQQKSRATQAS